MKTNAVNNSAYYLVVRDAFDDSTVKGILAIKSTLF